MRRSPAMRGRCLKSCIALTCTTALVACASPAPTSTDSTPAASREAPRRVVPEAAPEPAPSASEIAFASAAALGDLDAMASRGTIRVLVAPGPTDYFTDGRAQRGAAFDAGKALESFINTTLDSGQTRLRAVFIPTQPEQLLSSLTTGRGDIVVGRFAKTFEREEVVAFSEPIVTNVREVLATGPGVPPIVSLEDVAGRSIHVRRGSDHFASLTRLNAQLAKIEKPGCKIVGMDASLSDEDLLRMVNDGQVPLTLVDHHLAAAWRPMLEQIAINADVSVSQDGVFAWAVRQDSPQLLALVNQFIHAYQLQGLEARSVARWRAK